jgi:YVTN family beta-propeller protein
MLIPCFMRVWSWAAGAAFFLLVLVFATYLFSSGGLRRGASRLIFVSNYKGDTVSVVDDELAREVAVIEVGDSPDGMAIRRDPPLIALANGTGGRVTFIDPVSREQIGTAPVGEAPEDVAFGAGGKLLFVASTADKVVNVLDPDRREPVGDPIVFTDKPRRLAASRDGKRVYVLLSAKEGKVVAVDTQTRAVEGEVQVGGSIRSLAVTPDGRYLLVGRFDNDTVVSIDTQTMLPVKTYDVGTGYGIVVHPLLPILYSMVSFDDHVEVLNLDSGEIVATFSYGGWPTYSAITSDGQYLYVVHEDSDNVSKVDTATNQLVAKIAVGAEPGNAVIFEP